MLWLKFFTIAKSTKKSGWSEDMYVEHANVLYKDNTLQKFDLEHCVPELMNLPKFNIIKTTTDDSGSKINNIGSLDQARPIGQKKAKLLKKFNEKNNAVNKIITTPNNLKIIDNINTILMPNQNDDLDGNIININNDFNDNDDKTDLKRMCDANEKIAHTFQMQINHKKLIEVAKLYISIGKVAEAEKIMLDLVNEKTVETKINNDTNNETNNKNATIEINDEEVSHSSSDKKMSAEEKKCNDDENKVDNDDEDDQDDDKQNDDTYNEIIRAIENSTDDIMKPVVDEEKYY